MTAPAPALERGHDPGPDPDVDRFGAPRELDAERSVLAAALQHPDALRVLLAGLTPADYYQPAHALIHAAVAEVAGEGLRPDPTSVLAAVRRIGDRTGTAQALTVLTGIVTDAGATGSNAEHYVALIRDAATRRALIESCSRIVQRAHDPSEDVDDLADGAVADLTVVRDSGVMLDDVETPTVDEFLAGPVTYDWVVRGLLERRDRLILTGGEGGGKSTLMRQLAVCAAAGVHPFNHRDVEPCRVLLVDCENGRVHTRRTLGPLVETARNVTGRPLRGSLHVELQPQGINLATPQGRRFLLGKVERYRPDVLIVGPIYKLHAGNVNDEELARRMTQVIDEAREVAGGCCVLMEAHSPHASGPATRNGPAERPLRPAGASLFMRWPEFGFGLRRLVLSEKEEAAARQAGTLGERLTAVEAWRGPRDERSWPTTIQQGPRGSWPWQEAGW